LAEPLCPYDKYEQFRDIPKGFSREQKLEKIIDLLRSMPEINRDTILYLGRFFDKIVSKSEFNKMNAYNVAVIISASVFRTKYITSKDLMNQGTLADVFTLIMANVETIKENIKSRD
jgi:hypothetical protein